MYARVFQARKGLPRYHFFDKSLIYFSQSERLYGIQAYRTRYEMDKAYMRNVRNSDELHISFRYVNEKLHIDRDFNFCRHINERVEQGLTRIRNNVEKELTKRSKKIIKKRQDGSSSSQSSNSAALVDDAAGDATSGTLPPNFHKENTFDLLRTSDGESVRNITFAELLRDNKDGLELRVLDRKFEILLNQPWASSVSLPTSILAGYLVYPSKLDLQFAEEKFCKVSWYRAAMPPSGDLVRGGKWEHCYDGLTYTTTEADVGKYLKIILMPGNVSGQLGPPVENVAKHPVQNGPTSCPFEQRHLFTQKPLSAPGEMRVITYNLLADLYSDSDYSRNVLYPNCPPEALAMDYRKQLFLKEIIGYNADLMCLQEVDLKIFENDLKRILELPQHGFRGVIALKGSCPEGVATFYRTSRFELVNQFELHLGDNIPKLGIFAPLWDKIRKNIRLGVRVCDRSTTLQLTVLKCKQTGQYLMVANTHLYFHPDADHIRLLQAGASLIYIEHMYKQLLIALKIANPKNLGIIFCGDFNSVPECGIYKLMTECSVGPDFPDWRSNEAEAVVDVSLNQPFPMRSACGTPKYTNFTTLFSGCLDYIFFQSDRFDLLQSVPLPDEDVLQEHTAIPSTCFPSDHIALVADLKFNEA